MKNAITYAVDTLRSHPYLCALTGFALTFGWGAARLLAELKAHGL